LEKIVISEGVAKICNRAFGKCSSLEIVHLPVEVSNMEISAFADCPKLKAIYVPENRVDYYKERFPAEMHWLIVEEGADLPDKADNFIAKDISFTPMLRVVVPKGESDDYILSVVKKKLEDFGIRELARWILKHLDTIADSKVPYNEKDR
jgi:hypothetical protein